MSKYRKRVSAVTLASAVLGLALCSIIQPAAAQTTNSGVSIGPSEALNPSTQPPLPASQHLFGDWGGLRTYLSKYGISTILDYTGEFAGNITGGVKQGATLAGQVGFEVDIDWGKLAGVDGLSTHVVLVNRHGSSDSKLFGNDSLIPVQEIYGSGGDVAVHLVYAYAEQTLAGGRVDVAAGYMPVLNDFNASPLNCNFMNNSICGNPKTLPGADNGISSYPDATLGGRVRVRPTANTYLMAGLYGVNPLIYTYPADRSGFNFNINSYNGVEVPIEIAYEPTLGPDRLPGHYKAGFAYNSATNAEFQTSPANVLAGVPGARSHHRTFWLSTDQMLIRNGPGDLNGVILIADYAHSDPALSDYEDQFSIAILDRGFWKARPLDTIGLLFTWQSVSSALGKEQALDEFFGLPFAGSASGVQTHEKVLELNYDIAVYRGVNFQPEFQYVFRPNAQKNIPNAAVLGFKTHVDF